jgi:plastocyanin
MVLGVVGVLAVVSIGGSLLTRSSVSDDQAGEAVTADMTKFEFDPNDTTVSQGQKLLVSNSDPFAHDITLEESDIYEHLTPGSEALVD